MKSWMSVVVLALMAVMMVPVAAEEEVPPAVPNSVGQETPEFSADEWLAAQSQITLETLYIGFPCNDTFCSPGEFCCNFSCSICAPKGGACTQQVCPPTS